MKNQWSWTPGWDWLTLGSVGLRAGRAWKSVDSAAGQWSSQTYFDQLGKKRRQGRERQTGKYTQQDLTDVGVVAKLQTVQELDKNNGMFAMRMRCRDSVLKGKWKEYFTEMQEWRILSLFLLLSFSTTLLNMLLLSCRVKSLKLGTAHLASLGEATIVWNILNIWNNSWEVHYTESFEFFLLLCVSIWIHCNCCESKLPFCCRPKWRGKLGTFQGHLSNLKGGRCLTLKR